MTESGLHPIAEVMVTVVQDGPDDIPTFSDEGLALVRDAVDAYLDEGEALVAAVDQVLCAAHLLEVEKGAVEAARALVEIVDRPVVIDALIAINDARDAERAEAVEQQASDFQRFSDEERSKSAPKQGATTEEGAVKLDAFHFPKRL